MDQISLPNQDTIAAIATAQGKGGIAIIRISGKDALKTLTKVWKSTTENRFDGMKSHRFYKGQIIDGESDNLIDNVLCVFMKSPNSYTGEDVVEIHSHGGYLVPKRILNILLEKGIRPANPGEFTLRAFINGKMDLAQAEAVVDVVNAQTDEALKQAEIQLEGLLSQKINHLKEILLDTIAEVEAQVDFPEEEIDPTVKEEMINRTNRVIKELNKLISSYDKGSVIKEGVYTAILGKPNVGKSSLLNRLIMKERAIVSPYPGTTRDFIEETIVVSGIPLRLVDTAGLRATADGVERVGVELTKKKAREAEFIIAVVDGSSDLDEDDIEIFHKIGKNESILVINKTDIPQVVTEKRLNDFLPNHKIVKTSAKMGTGIEELKNTIYKKLLDGSTQREGTGVIISELRHKAALKKCKEGLNSFLKSLERGYSPEFLAVDLRYSMDSLSEITGEITTEDVLGRIFSKFCIGK